ncbi:MAG: toll/interleukin-1 receptor domain-containing protein [Desulfobacterales bacterium]|nr:toll/interleukin-1 receptor domain-containing protein [Desulfobacterales bacterium]
MVFAKKYNFFLEIYTSIIYFLLMSARVFIGYGEEDYETAKRLYDDLKNAGFNPWMDKENILVGQNWKLEIRQAIQDSLYFLILLSEKSLSDRGYFHKELKTALKILDEMPPSKIFILPVRLDACHLPYESLQDIQHIDLFSSYEEGLRQVVRVIKSPYEKENRCFADKSILGALAGIRFESCGNTQIGVIGDNAKVKGGIYQQIHYHQDSLFVHFWIAAGVIALICLISAWIFFQ